jgi:hypothetical protein
VQKPTQALQSVKGPANTFDWSPKWARTLPSLIYFSWDIYRDPPSTKENSNIKVDIWHRTVGLRCRNPPRQLGQLKTRPIPLIEVSSVQELCRPWYIFMGYLQRTPPLHNLFFKYQSWYLTPCCGLEVRKPTQALKLVKDQGNTFDWNPKWTKTLPFSIYFSCDIYKDPPPQNKIQISKLIFDTLLWAWGAETHTDT